MEERFLLNGVHIQRNRTAVNKAVELSFPVLSHPTPSSFGRGNGASMVAERTSHLRILDGAVKYGFFHVIFPISG
jgi:hypothetical protein